MYSFGKKTFRTMGKVDILKWCLEIGHWELVTSMENI